jgi:hypothetical protein
VSGSRSRAASARPSTSSPTPSSSSAARRATSTCPSTRPPCSRRRPTRTTTSRFEHLLGACVARGLPQTSPRRRARRSPPSCQPPEA